MAGGTQQTDGDLADSIAMLEQILEVMPQDEVALKALYNAFCQCGQSDRAFEYLGLLAGVAYANNHAETSAFVVKHMQDFEAEYPSETAAHLARLRTLVAPAEERRVEPQTATPSSSSTDADISEELSLAWKLFEENQLSQEEYSSILHDLTEVSSKELDVPVSVLHVLHDRGFNQMNRIINYMSSRSGVPYLSLYNFELPEQVGSVLPIAISAHEGALPFGFFGNDLLVGVLNPFNSVLLDKIETLSGHHCHTFLILPEDYDAGLERLRSMESAAA